MIIRQDMRLRASRQHEASLEAVRLLVSSNRVGLRRVLEAVGARLLILGVDLWAVLLRALVAVLQRCLIVLNTCHVLAGSSVARQSTDWRE